jgi:class 3 adenylate cyclase/TolB-like protein/Flp pilus assembly protein TadD
VVFEPDTTQPDPSVVVPFVARRRRLIAVMLADVVGYSGMMSRSEDETHARFVAHARELIEPTIDKHMGRLLRSVGDGLLVEFSSAVDAVRCALEIQRGLAARETDVRDGIQLRIGINTGDVLVDPRGIYGNSVNIAARLEALAAPGTVCVSASIYDQTRAHPELFFADRGEHRVKNIPYPIRVFQVASEPIVVPFLARLANRWTALAIVACVVAIAIGLIVALPKFVGQHDEVTRNNRIVVLPFRNGNPTAADDYLADAITANLTTELSRLRRAWVIASATAFNYKDKPYDPRRVGRELRVRYALQGSVKRSGAIVQVEAQLIDTESGNNLWTNTFAYETSSLLDLQDNLLFRIAAALNDEVTRAGIRQELGTLAADHNPLDERMRAMAASVGYPTAEKSLETRQHAEAGLKADPDNARLLGLLAAWLTSDVLNGWNGAGSADVERAEAAARKAIGLDPNTAMAHFALGWVSRLRGNHSDALDAFNQAIKIDPNFASAYAQAANEQVFLGNPAAAIPLVEQAAELSPQDPSIAVFLWVNGRAQFTLGNYDKAAEALQRSVDLRPNLWFTHAWLVAAYALTDRAAEAQKALGAFRQNHATRADLGWITRYYSEDQYRNPTAQAAAAELLNGLRKAGLK